MNKKSYKYKKDNVGGFFKLLRILIRNYVWLLPRAWSAKHGVMARLKELGWKTKGADLSLGFAEPELLSLAITFETDKELRKIENSSVAKEVKNIFQLRLKKHHYPSWAVPKTEVTFHSLETINRAGGWYNYFK